MQHQIGALESSSIVAKNRANAGSVAVNTAVYATPQTYDSLNSLDAAVAAISAAIYPQKVIDSMTMNDKVYACRLANDPGTL